MQFDCYFLIKTRPGYEHEVLSHLERRFQSEFSGVKIVDKVDLTAINHLAREGDSFIKVSFKTINKLIMVKRYLIQKIQEQKKAYKPKDIYEQIVQDPFEYIEQIYEHDISYSAKTTIELNLRVGFWYQISV